ncbi:unnamed protein product [Heterobilharzia americana]|nr:unnamed protein product [Heterobilharzia americana]
MFCSASLVSGNAFCLSVHSSSILRPVFYRLYSASHFFVHPSTGSSSVSLSSFSLSASLFPSRSTSCLVSFSFPIRLCRFRFMSLSKTFSVLPSKFLQGCCSMSPILS